MDLYPNIANRVRDFFGRDLLSLPPQMAGKILRVEVRIPDLAPLSWLERQTADVKTYWADRQGDFTMAGVGAVETIGSDSQIDYATVFDRLRQKLSPLFPAVRYYGGIGFSQADSFAERSCREIAPNWKLFGNYRFIIPRFEIWTDGVDTFFACNFSYQPAFVAEQLAEILQELAGLDLNLFVGTADLSLPDRRSLPKLHDRLDLPDWQAWQRNIELALTKFVDLDLDKIVLARQSILTFDTNLQPQALLLALQPYNDRSYHFCFQIDPTTAFIGTSPERLYCRHDRILKTEAIAGTRQRGESSQLDRELSDRLRNSPKDIHEHQLVVNNLQAILSELCHSSALVGVGTAADTAESQIERRELTILKLNKVQHLYTQFQGILQPHLSDADILPKLHPTPAVGGFPRDLALQTIRELEPFDRGWYAAPVGWVGYDAAEFAVAIRSGAIAGDRLFLFAGAGIVRGSQAAEEWIEIENKIRHFTDLFTDLPPQQVSDLSLV